MGKITENFTEAEIERLRDDFIGNEAGSDEYRETQPHKTFLYLHSFDEGILYWNRRRLAEALIKWAQGVITDLDSDNRADQSYAGADAWGDLGNLIFDLHLEIDEHPYLGSDIDAIRELGSDIDAIREELTDTE